ncbi:LOW QUALITY PROTEIN: melanocortin receptor 3, partial [Diretmus argenteus]
IQLMDNFFDSMICICLVASTCNLLATTIDCYVTIFYALCYSIVTQLAIRSIIWLSGVVCGIVFIIYVESKTVIVCLITMFFFTMLVLMATLNMHMFLLAKLNVMHIAALSVEDVVPQQTCMKGAITITILLGVFCWMLFFLHILLLVACPKNPYCACYMSHFTTYLVLIMRN